MNKAHSVTPSQTFNAQQQYGTIDRLCEAIVQGFQPEKIILFGSYAYGEPHANSDVDLLVIMPFEGSPFRQAARILEFIVQKIGVLPIDVLVRTAEHLKAREEMGDRFIRDILERGKILYEANHAGMGQ